MQLIENKQTRLQLWSRQARATRWGVSCVFPPADRSEEDILVVPPPTPFPSQASGI